MTPYGLKVRVGDRRLHEHRLIAERALGKPLPRSADVHHVDGRPLNNEPSNLVICQDRAYHQLLHVRERVFRAGGNPNTDRICCVCRLTKPFQEFNLRRSRAGGLSQDCRACHKARHQQHKARKAGVS